jgi:hypothetical protein
MQQTRVDISVISLKQQRIFKHADMISAGMGRRQTAQPLKDPDLPPFITDDTF